MSRKIGFQPYQLRKEDVVCSKSLALVNKHWTKHNRMMSSPLVLILKHRMPVSGNGYVKATQVEGWVYTKNYMMLEDQYKIVLNQKLTSQRPEQSWALVCL